MSLQPFAAAPSLSYQAATPPLGAGFALQNGTPNIISWTAPSDGNQHRFQIFSSLHVTSAETGGILTYFTTQPDGTASNHQLYAGTLGAGPQISAFVGGIIESGSTVTIVQTSALTAGAATLWAEIWGS